MLKANIGQTEDGKTSIQMEVSGDIRRMCSDISAIVYAIYERISEKNPDVGYEFKILFTKGFMDGACFRDDREHMEHYLAEGDKKYTRRKDDPLLTLLDDLVDFLKSRNAKMEDDDEAE